MKRLLSSTSAIALCALLGLTGTASAGTYYDAVMADNPVGYWRMNDAGSPVVDATGNAHDGTIINPGSVTVQDPGALYNDPDTSMDFAGTNGRVQVPYDAALNPAAFTVELWAKVEGGSSYRSPLTGRGGAGGQQGYLFYAEPGNTWQCWAGTGTGWHASTGPAVQTGEWAYLVGTFEPTSGPVGGVYTGIKRLYVNGVQVDSDSGALFKPNAVSNLHFGGGGDTGSSYLFNGDVDEVAVYNGALSAAQIRYHYNVANSNYTRTFDFANPGVDPSGLPLGPDASKLVFAGRTAASPTPTNPDGTLVLGGSGTGGMVFTDAVPNPILFDRPLVIETEAYYYNGDAPAAQSNAYMGLKALHLMGDAGGATDEEQRRGGLWAQFQPYTTGSGHMRLGFQTALASGTDLWFDSAASSSVSGIPDANGLFNMQLSISGLDDDDEILFLVSQDQWSAHISTTIGQYRDALPANGIQQAFDLVLSELRADPSLMQVGFISTPAREDAYNYLRVFAAVPEPSTVILLLLGGVGLVGCGWRRRRRA